VRRSRAVQVVGVLLIVGALVTGAALLQRVREARYPAAAVVADELYLTSPAAVKRFAIGYSSLAADLYWIRAIQYYGGIRLRLSTPPSASQAEPVPTNYDLLYPLLVMATTLDPQFNIAYRFGSIFLAEPFPGGAGRPDLAIALLEKGLEHHPGKWEYMQDIGFVNYWWRRDYRAAADWFDRAGKVPGAPWWLKSLAANKLIDGGDRRTSRIMWEALRETADNEWLRQDAERRLMQLTAFDQIESLQQLVDRYTRLAGAPPPNWAPLIRQRIVRGIPTDPSGRPYELDADGRVRLARTSKLWPLPDEPLRLDAPTS
jgi:hypothetical protein